MKDQPQIVLKAGVASGLAAGLLTGVAARIAMRIFALAEGMRPEFSVGGTLAILVIFGVLFGIPLGMIYVRFWRRPTWIGAWNGLAFGTLLLIVLIVLPFLLIPSDDATLARRLLAIGSFVPVPLVYGLTVGLAAERWFPAALT